MNRAPCVVAQGVHGLVQRFAGSARDGHPGARPNECLGRGEANAAASPVTRAISPRKVRMPEVQSKNQAAAEGNG